MVVGGASESWWWLGREPERWKNQWRVTPAASEPEPKKLSAVTRQMASDTFQDFCQAGGWAAAPVIIIYLTVLTLRRTCMYCRVKSLFCFIDVELGTCDNCRDIPKPCSSLSIVIFHIFTDTEYRHWLPFFIPRGIMFFVYKHVT